MSKRILMMLVACLLILSISALSGCGKSDNAGDNNSKVADQPKDKPSDQPKDNPSGDSKPADKPAEPVVEKIETAPAKLTVFLGQSIADELWNIYLEEPLKKKYPHITLEKLSGKLPDIIAAGTVPDLLTQFNGYITDFIPFKLLTDITPLVKKHNFDLSRFDKVYLDAITVISDKGELYGIPYSTQFNALYYNRDLFDRFAQDYPKDGMTWDEAIVLAERVTGKLDDVQYVGLSYEHISRLSSSLSPDIVDRSKEQANVNNDMWKRVFELGHRISSIPGNFEGGGFSSFLLDKNVSMMGTVSLFDYLEEAVAGGLNFGIAQYPSFPEQPNVYGYVDAHYMLISEQSKYKDQAMQVIEVMTSDEVQLTAARKFARLSALKNPEIKLQFAADMPTLKEVSISSIFKSRPSSAPAFSEHYRDARKILMAKFDEYNAGQIDVNTALREAEDLINKKIAEKTAK